MLMCFFSFFGRNPPRTQENCLELKHRYLSACLLLIYAAFINLYEIVSEVYWRLCLSNLFRFNSRSRCATRFFRKNMHMVCTCDRPLSLTRRHYKKTKVLVSPYLYESLCALIVHLCVCVCVYIVGKTIGCSASSEGQVIEYQPARLS